MTLLNRFGIAKIRAWGVTLLYGHTLLKAGTGSTGRPRGQAALGAEGLPS